MAGRGSRFAEAGFSDPKPLIPIHGRPMIQWVIKNLTPEIPHRFIFIAQRDHINRYDLESKLLEWAPNSLVVPLDGVTDGAARTALMAKNLIDNEHALMIANSDQWIDADINEYVSQLSMSSLDGLIMTMTATDPKWSFVSQDDQGFVTQVVEKEAISNVATVGIYGFARGNDFVEAAEKMIGDAFQVNNEFYVAPVYNWMIKDSKKVRAFGIGSEANGMYGLGIPSDLALFEESQVSKNVW